MNETVANMPDMNLIQNTINALMPTVIGCSIGVGSNALWDLIKSKAGVSGDLVIALERDPNDEARWAELKLTLLNIIGQNDGLEDELRRLLGVVLIPWQSRARESWDESESKLLTPYQRITKFIGRSEDMDELIAWAESDKPIAIRLITGRAGSGKTRTAIELMRDLEEKRWRNGFLTIEEMKRFSGQQNLSDWNWRTNVLAVVDYAAAASEELRIWFRHLRTTEKMKAGSCASS